MIIEDRLGIGAELEAMMEGDRRHLGASGRAHWRIPDKLKLFEAFVNRPEDETPPRREEGAVGAGYRCQGGGMSGVNGFCTPAISIKEVV